MAQIERLRVTSPTSSSVDPATANPELDEMLRMAGARKTDRIMIAGRDHFDWMIGLCGRGFTDVGCRDAQRGPHISGFVADLLVIPDIAGDVELAAALRWLGRELRPGGVLVLRHRMATAEGRARLRRLLMEQGYALEFEMAGASPFLRAWKQPARAQRNAA